jgi:xylulokinase
VAEAGCLGAAIMAGIGSGAFQGFPDGVEAMVSLGDRIEPDPGRQRSYEAGYQRHRELWPLLKSFLRGAQ